MIEFNKREVEFLEGKGYDVNQNLETFFIYNEYFRFKIRLGEKNMYIEIDGFGSIEVPGYSICDALEVAENLIEKVEEVSSSRDGLCMTDDKYREIAEEIIDSLDFDTIGKYNGSKSFSMGDIEVEIDFSYIVGRLHGKLQVKDFKLDKVDIFADSTDERYMYPIDFDQEELEGEISEMIETLNDRLYGEEF